MKRLLPVFLIFSFSTQAQELLHCGADEMRIQTLEANPEIAKAVINRDDELEAFTREYAIRQAQGTQRGGQVYTIPVVFHVIHDFGNENISREQIMDGLRVLNETFRKTREDTADIHTDFQAIHADCEIEFALATKDPEGNCHSGINRIASDLTNSGDHRVKELIHWDPSMYLNVYITSNAAGLAGHAVWPADADTIPEWDGIVIAHSYVGSIGTSNPTQSVVFAHECGHYLNLHHPWGGNNVPGFYYLPVGQQANCDEDDLVADTPNTIGWSSCDLSASSCGNQVDNVQNVMEYSYCNIMFTEGQKTRMRACLNSSIANRNNLWSPANLAATGVDPALELCAADFSADESVVCPHIDNTITFSNTSYHGETDSLLWQFSGGFPPSSTSDNPTIAYSTSGKHNVQLTVYSNGNSESITKENFISVLQDSSWSYPFWDWFEDAPSFDGMRWFENSLDEVNKWEITDMAAFSGSRAAYVDNWENNTITVDRLYGPPIDLSNASQMRLAFKYAFSGQFETTNDTKLQVQVSRNCESSWSTRLNINGSDLETAALQSTPFIPESSDWEVAEINIPSSYLEDGFRFRLVFTSNGNNRLYIDDVNIDINAGIDDAAQFESRIRLFPNPVSDVLNVKFELDESAQLSFTVFDVLGRVQHEMATEKFTTGKNTQQLHLKHLDAGVYYLAVDSRHGRTLKTFIIF
jgi:PKD repeat protein